MEEDRKQIVHGECLRKLNFNLPLLSTRRPFGATTDDTFVLAKSSATLTDTSNMVPFSWERIPGQPKYKEADDDDDDDCGNADLPPPPGRWLPPATDETKSAAAGHAVDQCCDICDGNEVEGRNERFSDAIDIFSLAESSEENCRDGSSTLMERNGDHSPNFMIQRFLPDAQALAEASVINKKLPDSSASFFGAVGIRRSYHSPRGCGLSSFFPWRMKPKPCGVKSPVMGRYNQKPSR